jgi:LDH2 family malate/lactate/ureidoglycolate dehydrogenase
MPGEIVLTDGQAVQADALRKFVAKVFQCAGVSDSQTQDATDVLMWASLRGIDTHGVRNLKSLYVDPILDGQVNFDAKLLVEQETVSTARADGDAGLGLALSCDTMRLAIDKAETSGVGIVNVRNSHHLGVAGYFAHMAVEHDQLGICMTGEFLAGRQEIGIASINSHQPLFSSNPLSLAAPCGRHAPYVLDMSTSVVPINRVQRYGQLGQAIPLGWAMDAAGRATTDPAAACVMMPLGGSTELGGHKGVGLAMMVSILSAVLSGAWAQSKVDNKDASLEFRQWSKAHFFAAIRVDQFLPPKDFRNAMDAMIDAIRDVPRENANEPIYYPGDKEHQTALNRSHDGIPLTSAEIEDFRTLAKMFSVDLPE